MERELTFHVKARNKVISEDIPAGISMRMRRDNTGLLWQMTTNLQ
jgi:hypothetical protein